MQSFKVTFSQMLAGFFKPNAQNNETCILSKLLHQFQPTFAQSSAQSCMVQIRPNKPKMADSRHLENR